jgi:hypothetical protein
MFALLVGMALAAGPDSVAACPCTPNSVCADARCGVRGGSRGCACYPPAPSAAAPAGHWIATPAPKFLDEPADERWNALYARVERGERMTIYAGVPMPAGAVGETVDRTADGQTGVFRCFLSEGRPRMEPVEAAGRTESASLPPVVPKSVATIPGHEHQCGRCGTIWAHADGDPTASHRCPKCGRTQYVQLRAVAIPAFAPSVRSAPQAAPSPVRDSAPLFDLRRLVAPGRSNCPNGQCPNAPPVAPRR